MTILSIEVATVKYAYYSNNFQAMISHQKCSTSYFLWQKEMQQNSFPGTKFQNSCHLFCKYVSNISNYHLKQDDFREWFLISSVQPQVCIAISADINAYTYTSVQHLRLNPFQCVRNSNCRSAGSNSMIILGNCNAQLKLA